MKRAAMVFGVLAVAALVAAQQQQAPAQQKQPAGAAGTTQSGSAQSGSATATPPQGKRPPQAKTQAEFDAYNAAIANQKDPAAMEKSADDFATKFPWRPIPNGPVVTRFRPAPKEIPPYLRTISRKSSSGR